MGVGRKSEAIHVVAGVLEMRKKSGAILVVLFGSLVVIC